MSDPRRKSRLQELLDAPDSALVEAADDTGTGAAPEQPRVSRLREMLDAPDEAFQPARASGSHVIEMPVQQIEGDVRPWYQKLRDVIAAAPTPGNLAARPVAQAMGAGFEKGISAGAAQNLPGGVGDLVRAGYNDARSQNQPMFDASQGAGALASPNPFKGSGLAASAAAGAANAGGYAAVHDFSDSTDEDAGARAQHALKAAAIPAAVGGVAPAALGLLGKGLDKGSVTARRFAMGGTPKQYGELVDEQGTRAGIDYLQRDLGRIPEEQGLTNILIPQSKATLARKAAARTEDVLGPQIGDALDRAAGEIPAGAVDRGRVEARIIGRADALEQKARPGWRESDQALEQAKAAPMRSPRDVAELKRDFEAEAYAPGAVGGSQESRYAQAQNHAATATRDHLREVMGQASPETNRAFTQGNADYSDTKLVENMSRKGAIQDLALPVVGATAGGAYGYYRRHDAQGIAGGMATGAALGHYGPDLAANLLRLSEKGASALGNSAPGLAKVAAAMRHDPAAELDEEERQRLRREAEGLMR